MNLGEVYLDADIALDVDEDEIGVGNEIEDKREEEETSRCGIWQWWRHRHTEHCRKTLDVLSPFFPTWVLRFVAPRPLQQQHASHSLVYQTPMQVGDWQKAGECQNSDEMRMH
ncbi:hypothetical protein Ac2012v2_007487 [Leucoagaricus gongylophorus]